MKNINIARLEMWAINAITLDEVKVGMDDDSKEALEAMEEMALWRIFPELKGKWDRVKGEWFDAYAYVKDYVFGKDTASDIDWKKLEIEDLSMLYIWLKSKRWGKE